jgi:hypothetical protein
MLMDAVGGFEKARIFEAEIALTPKQNARSSSEWSIFVSQSN